MLDRGTQSGKGGAGLGVRHRCGGVGRREMVAKDRQVFSSPSSLSLSWQNPCPWDQGCHWDGAASACLQAAEKPLLSA